MRRTDEAFKNELFRRYEQYKKNRRNLRILASAPAVLSILFFGILLLPNLNIFPEQPIANEPTHTTAHSLTTDHPDRTNTPDEPDEPDEPDTPDDPIVENNLIFERDHYYSGYTVVGTTDPYADTIVIPATYNGRAVVSIGDSAFRDHTRIRKVVIEGGVTTIGDYAFAGCENLGEVTLPDTLTDIGDSAFVSCIGLSDIDLPDSLERIGEYAFNSCDMLRSVNFSDGLKQIGESAFAGCNSLTEVTIPNGVESIGEWAFSSCIELRSISFPASVTDIGEGVLDCCASLISITVDEDNDVYHSAINCLIETKSKTLLAGCLDGEMPDDGSVKIIGKNAYSLRISLDSITIPEGVTEIRDDAFAECISLVEVSIPSTLTKLGEDVFSGCGELCSITVASGNDLYHSAGGCLIETKSKTVIRGFYDCIIPDDGSVTRIGSRAFDSCQRLYEIVIPDGVTSIGDHAFFGCDYLEVVTIPDSVTTIEKYAFGGCNNLSYALFENAIGWTVDGTRLGLADPSAAAGYLISYDGNVWQCD